MNTKKNRETSEENFLKNRAKRVNSASKHEEAKKPVKKKSSSKKKSDKKATAIKFACIVLCVLVAICLAIAGTWIYFASKKPDAHISNEGNSLSGADTTFETEDGVTASLAENVYTFLALGTDKSGSLTDVIMVANYDINTQSVSILQIPRDTYVKTSSKLTFDEMGSLLKDNFTGGFGGKINSAYSHARSLSTSYIDKLLGEAKKLSDEQVKKLVKSPEYAFLSADPEKIISYNKTENRSEKQKIYANITRDFGIKYLSTLIYYNFGIPVDYYAQVNLSGFRGIVDAIGGVEMYVPEDMYYNDPYQDLHINIKKGQQTLNGEQAEDFVRFRSGYARADLARLDAQKMFMSAFLKKLFSASSIPKIGNIITEIQKNLYTNLPLDDTLYFANKAISIDLSTGITMTTLPGTGANINGGSYYSANKAAVMKLVNGSFNKYDTALPEDRFILTEVSSTPVEVSTSTVGDIENNTPDLGFIPEDNRSNLKDEENGTTPDVETDIDEGNSEVTDTDGENTDDGENPENNEDIGGDIGGDIPENSGEIDENVTDENNASDGESVESGENQDRPVTDGETVENVEGNTEGNTEGDTEVSEESLPDDGDSEQKSDVGAGNDEGSEQASGEQDTSSASNSDGENVGGNGGESTESASEEESVPSDNSHLLESFT